MPARSALNSGHLESFLAKFRATIIVLSGAAKGMEHVLDQYQISLGRGPGVDLALDEPFMRSQHATLEFADGAFHLCNLAGEEGSWLNGRPIDRAELKNEDRFILGRTAFSFMIDTREERDALIR